MKKIVFATAVLCAGTQAFDYHIENKTHGQIEIVLEYEAESLCSRTARIIKENQSVIIKAGPCRARQIRINGKTYQLALPKPAAGAPAHTLKILIEDKLLNNSMQLEIATTIVCNP